MSGEKNQSIRMIVWSMVLVSVVLGFPNGAPETSCLDLSPRHGGSTSKNGPSPFLVTPKANTTKAGELIKIKLEPAAGQSSKFKGFMMQAINPKTNKTIGSFKSANGIQTLTCVGTDDTITHTSKGKKASLTVSWKAPATYSGPVKFRATILTSFSTYWVGVESTAPVTVTAKKGSKPASG